MATKMTNCMSAILENCKPNSICFELIKGVPTVTAAVIVGIIASYIAYRQWRTAHAKLKLDLFEKRYALFLDVWNFLSRPAMANQLTGLDQVVYLNEFKKKIPIANFLFGKKIEAYMNEAVKKLAELDEIRRINSTKSVSSDEDNKRSSELRTWFHDQSENEVRKLFEPFLSFKNLK